LKSSYSIERELPSIVHLRKKTPTSTPDGRGLTLGHKIGMGRKSLLLNLNDASMSIRAENDAEQFGNEVIKLFAVVWIGDRSTLRTRSVSIFRATTSHLAPRCLLIFVASGAAFSTIGPTRSAI
jgi:hypothetical protein